MFVSIFWDARCEISSDKQGWQTCFTPHDIVQVFHNWRKHLSWISEAWICCATSHQGPNNSIEEYQTIQGKVEIRKKERTSASQAASQVWVWQLLFLPFLCSYTFLKVYVVIVTPTISQKDLIKRKKFFIVFWTMSNQLCGLLCKSRSMCK